MNLLHANDAPGTYPPSWYAATVSEPAPYAPLRGAQRADVCVIGGGYTGLSAALHLAEAGLDVALLEAHRAGFGASGRNGGQLGSGQRQDQQKLETMLGMDDARAMWTFGEQAKKLVRDLITRHKIDCHLKDGVAWAGRSDASVRDLHQYAEHMARHYNYPLEALGSGEFHKICPSPDLRGGVLDMGAAHLHPLALAFGLAQAANDAGARIYEQSEAIQIDQGRRITVRTAQGQVQADHLILACNGYLGGLMPQVARRVMPINNFIVATEPLAARTALCRDIAICDDRFVVNYWRMSHDNRLLFGGGESYGYRFPKDIRAVVRRPLEQIYPQLKGVKLDYAWGGTLAITMKRLPHLTRIGPNILSASGYSGHGLGNAVQAGQLMAEAVRGQASGFDAFAALPTPPFPGNAPLRAPLLALAMSWFALRDKIGL